MSIPLLDANVLIALTLREHEHHDRASRWAAGIDGFALCPIVEGALFRFHVRLGESISTSVGVLDGIHRRPGCVFWTDSESYRDIDLSWVHGHRQVTDAYLIGLAAAHDGVLATLDEPLARTAPTAALLLPH